MSAAVVRSHNTETRGERRDGRVSGGVVDRSDGLASRGLLAASTVQVGLKRAIDVIGATFLLVLMAPILAVIALAVRFNSPGPALFVQERIGKDGTPFRFYKFRSMYTDSERVRQELHDENEADGPVFKIRKDPRVTPVGAIIRKLSLDELPQLASVVAGHMSLVGPRPPLPDEVAHYTEHERQRLLATPGLTCIWQISGRSDICFDEWVQMDLEYIRNWSLWLDLKILLRTLPAVVSGRGAY